jgi:predicted ATP-dependent protease
MTPEKKEPRVMNINEQAEKEALEKFPVVMVDTGAKGIKYDPNYPNRKNFEEKRLLQLQISELEEANKRLVEAVKELKTQRNRWAICHEVSPAEHKENMRIDDEEIEAILNPTMEK